VVHGVPAPVPAETWPRLAAAGGVFVTVRCDGALRGCIGHVAAAPRLAEMVARVAVSAATQDPRFAPVAVGELDVLRVEISVLGAPVRVEPPDPERIRVGDHGVIVRRGGLQGLLLPQVATEYGWDAEALLAATCRKAGLPPEEWRRPGCEVYVFEADVFGE
jgi:AmmeMemoRadiSam system protein A